LTIHTFLSLPEQYLLVKEGMTKPLSKESLLKLPTRINKQITPSSYIYIKEEEWGKIKLTDFPTTIPEKEEYKSLCF